MWTNNTWRINMTMAKDFPKRSTAWNQSGDNGAYGGQFRPGKARYNGIETEKISIATDYEEQWYEDAGDAYDAVGYGNPTAGIYSLSNRGWKTFGSVGQGSIEKAVRMEGAYSCLNRWMLVTIYANEYMGDKTIFLEAGSFSFADSESQSSTTGGGTYIQVATLSAAFALIVSTLF